MNRMNSNKRSSLAVAMLIISGFGCASGTSSTPGISTPRLFAECRSIIGLTMGRDPSTIEEDYSKGSLVGIRYIRDDDGKEFKYECKVEDGNLVWRGVDIFGPGQGPGRWRVEDAMPVR